MADQILIDQDPQDLTGEDAVKIPEVLPVLPLRDIVIFPFMIVPLFVQRERSIRSVEQVLSDNRLILLLSQRDGDKDEPVEQDLHQVGTVAVVMRMMKLPDGRIRILVQGISRALVKKIEETPAYLRATITPLTEPKLESSLELEALTRNIKNSMEKAITLGKNISPEVMAITNSLEDAGRLADLVASNLELKVAEAQTVLEQIDPSQRLRRVNELLAREISVLQVQQEINSQAKGEIDRSQREYYLRQQLKAIQQELGEGNELLEEINQYREKLPKSKCRKKSKKKSCGN
ncbi:MAG TPA: LON peptidase substrate-binding domain-containing protein [Acidobacteriota bacterium]|nr:LON peptidase substrate-binding domain-containing protein [Acidobacteriota bacterium]